MMCVEGRGGERSSQRCGVHVLGVSGCVEWVWCGLAAYGVCYGGVCFVCLCYEEELTGCKVSLWVYCKECRVSFSVRSEE